jgi:DNA-binding transcriptional LysR family regulator
MNLSQIELLRILQENDFSLSKANKEMQIEQSAVSRQLQLLEAELGSRIYDRQEKIIGLTNFGLLIME